MSDASDFRHERVQARPGLLIGGTAAAILLLGAVSLSSFGASEAALRRIVRNTAQIGVVLFLLAFTASSLQLFLRLRFTKWLLRNRRYLGLAFALAHFSHLAALVALGACFPDPFLVELNPVTLLGGGLGYAFLFALTVTSSDAAQRRLGGANWRRLHTLGSYYLWGIFAQSYIPRGFEDPFYLPFGALLLAAMALRLARRARLRQRHEVIS